MILWQTKELYVNYNDYELLYLIKEGINPALKLMFYKYDHLIYLKSIECYPYGDKHKDLVQEGRLILYKCIKNYSFDYEVSFFSYFLISLKRMLERKMGKDYYQDILFLNENAVGEEPRNDYIFVFKRKYKNDYLAMMIYDECVIGESSLIEVAINYNVNYNKLIRKRNEIRRYLKKYID